MENVRKNSSMMPPAVSAPSPPVQPATYTPVQVQDPQVQRPQVSSKPSSPAPAPAQSQSPRPFANAPRYNLADPGSGSASGPRPSQPPSSFGPPRREGRSSLDNRPEQAGPPPDPSSGPGAYNGPPRKGPATFAEMGITTAKVQDKECVIM